MRDSTTYHEVHSYDPTTGEWFIIETTDSAIRAETVAMDIPGRVRVVTITTTEYDSEVN